MDKNDIVVVGAARTPIGKYKGIYRFEPAWKLGARAINGAIDSARRLTADQIDCVLMGMALPAGLGQHPARQAALAAGLPNSVRVEHVYKVCSTGTSQILHACNMLSSPFEKVKVVVAGGMENMTRAPLITHPYFNTVNEGGKERIEKVFEKRGYDAMLQDGLWDAFEFEKHMGVLAERIAKELGITREDADRFAYLSHKRSWEASNSEAFNNYIVHVPILSMPLAMTRCDETLWHPSPEKLASLGPVFAKDGVITAGNASQIADGAAAVVLMKRETADQMGIRPFAHIVAFADHSGEPSKYLTAPVDAFVSLAQKTLGRYDKQWAPHHFDLIELNEAFAVGNVAFMKAFKLDWKFVEERMNVLGGSIALGHPLGSTGTRLLISLMTALRMRGLRFGAWGQCNGAGEAVMGSVAIE